MVARQLRLIALAKDLTQQGMAPNDVGSQIGVTAQYPLRKTLEQSRRLSWDDLNRRYRRLLDADLAIKRGRQEPDAALELMVADLSRGRAAARLKLRDDRVVAGGVVTRLQFLNQGPMLDPGSR